MVTLSYGALFGLLLAAFIMGLLSPLLLMVYLIFREKPR